MRGILPRPVAHLAEWGDNSGIVPEYKQKALGKTHADNCTAYLDLYAARFFLCVGTPSRPVFRQGNR